MIGIPSEVHADVLEKKVLKIFGNSGCDILSEQIEARHRISKKVQQ